MPDLTASPEAYASVAASPRDKGHSIASRELTSGEIGSAEVSSVRLATQADAPTALVQRASERFGVALALSALTGVCAAPLLAHGSAVESDGMIGLGLACVVTAVVVQFTERRRALKTLVDDARARGLDPSAAKIEAKTTLKRWLS